MTDHITTRDPKDIRKGLDKVSPTFCRAKWKQVTIHLHNGMTHSCHHPTPHKVPMDELARNPSALHNTTQKNKARMDLLNGVKTKECDYCWNVENTNPDADSDRIYKSGEWWADDEQRPISLEDPQLFDNPSYVEVSFSSVCNFACSYCSPQVSSKWVEDVKANGPYQMENHAVHSLDWLKAEGMMPIPEREENPYVEAFWKWWPDLYPSLKVFRITGGEPLLSKHTWRVLDYIDKNPRPDLQLGINTNLGVPFKFIEKLVEYTNRMVKENKLKSVDLYTSVDTWGPQATYIRDPMEWEPFLHNFKYVLDNTAWTKGRCKITIMCTFNLLSIPNFQGLLDFILDWRKAHPETKHWLTLWLDIAYLRYPNWQIARLADAEHIAELKRLVAYMTDHKRTYEPGGRYWGFKDHEISKLARLVDWVESPMPDAERETLMKNFYRFFSSYDRRRGLDFKATFPTLVPFYEECERLTKR